MVCGQRSSYNFMPTSNRSEEVHSQRLNINGTLEKIDKRKNRKAALNNNRTRSEKIRAQAAYTEATKMVKTNIRADKRAYMDSLVVGKEAAAHYDNRTPVYANTRKLSGIFNMLERPIKDQNGALIAGEGQRKSCM